MEADGLHPGLMNPLIGDTFTVAGAPDADPELELDIVVEHARSPGSPRPDPFTLTFAGSTGDHLPQATYTLEHPVVGSVEIFLVPRGPGPDGRHRYDAVFN